MTIFDLIAVSICMCRSQWPRGLRRGSVAAFFLGLRVRTPPRARMSVVNCQVGSLHFLSITNKIERYTIFFIIVSALHISGGFSAHHQELKNCSHSIGYMWSLLAATASGSSKQAWHIPDALWTVLSSWWWAEKPPEMCTALTVINNIV